MVVAVLALLQIARREELYGIHDWRIAAAGYGAAALGILFLFREVYRFFVPGEPLLTLAQRGIVINIDGTTCIEIPWGEVQDIATIDVKTHATLPINVNVGGVLENEVEGTYRNVTAVAVSQDLYDRAISPAYKAMKQNNGLKTALGLVDGMVHHIDARNGLGPGWSSIFVRRDDQMLVALHHSMLPVGSSTLRAAVESRWRAFSRPQNSVDAAMLRS